MFGMAQVAILISAGSGIGGAGYALLAADPPQPDYSGPVRITRLNLSTNALPPPEIVGAQPLFDVFNELIPVLKGALDASERAQGASLAGDTRWETAHSSGARMLTGCATAGLLQLVSRMRQFRVAGLDTVELDQSSYNDFQERARRGQLLSDEASKGLLRAGLSSEQLIEFEERVANHDVATLPAGQFASVINEISDELESAALRLITG
jgi:hypothetical protein